MSVRKATLEDLGQLMKLAKDLHYAYSARRWVMFEDNIDGWSDWFCACIADEENSLIYVACDDKDAVVGFLCANVGPVFCAPYKTKVGYERLIWVDEKCRGESYGTDMIKQFCKDAKEKGCSDVYIGVSTRFPGAKKLGKVYTDLGFKLEERHYCRRL